MDFRNTNMKIAKYYKKCGSCNYNVVKKGDRCIDCTEWGKCEYSREFAKISHIDQGWDEDYLNDKYGE